MDKNIELPLIQIPTQSPVKRTDEQSTPGIRKSRMSHLSVHSAQTALYYIRDTWRSGMAQAILNMPFHLTIGANSGCDASMGITTAFVSASVNGFFSGSNHSIYMPSWVVIGLNYGVVQRYGVEAIPWISVMVGTLIYLSSLLKWHHLSDFIPVYVIEGFLLGIASIFFLTYSDYAFGLTDNHSNRGVKDPTYFQMYESFIHRGDFYYLIAALSIFACLQIGRNYNRTFPWIIISTLIGLAIGILFPTERCLKSAYGEVGIRFQFIEFSGPKFNPSIWLFTDLIAEAIPIALFIMVQNQFCARAGQSLTGVKCDYDQEVICVSVANILSGICGGLPCCASSRMYVLDMTLRNTNKWSSILNAISILIFYGFFSKLFMSIPLYVISGQLLYMFFNIPPWHYFKELYHTQRTIILVQIIVIAWVCVHYGAIQSTLIGSMHSLICFAQKMSIPAAEILSNALDKGSHQLRDDKIHSHDAEHNDLPLLKIDGNTYTLYRFSGALNYINIKGHIEQIKRLAKTDYFVISFRYVCVFDYQAIDQLSIVLSNMTKSGIEVILTGLHSGMMDELRHNQYFRDLFENNPDNCQEIN